MMARPSSVSPRLRKQALRLDRVQIPHRRAREKSSPAAAGAIKRNLKYIQEIALNGTDPERWEARSNPLRRFCKEGVGDIDRHVASRVTQPCQHKLRLNAGSRTMLDENHARTLQNRRCDSAALAGSTFRLESGNTHPASLSLQKVQIHARRITDGSAVSSHQRIIRRRRLGQMHVLQVRCCYLHDA